MNSTGSKRRRANRRPASKIPQPEAPARQVGPQPKADDDVLAFCLELEETDQHAPICRRPNSRSPRAARGRAALPGRRRRSGRRRSCRAHRSASRRSPRFLVVHLPEGVDRDAHPADSGSLSFRGSRPGRGPGLVHHAAVGEEDDAVGGGGGPRVVGHHEDGLVVAGRGLLQKSEHPSAGLRVQVPVGSSARMMSGFRSGPARSRPAAARRR